MKGWGKGKKKSFQAPISDSNALLDPEDTYDWNLGIGMCEMPREMPAGV